MVITLDLGIKMGKMGKMGHISTPITIITTTTTTPPTVPKPPPPIPIISIHLRWVLPILWGLYRHAEIALPTIAHHHHPCHLQINSIMANRNNHNNLVNFNNMGSRMVKKMVHKGNSHQLDLYQPFPSLPQPINKVPHRPAVHPLAVPR